jgi:hypothetical protein
MTKVKIFILSLKKFLQLLRRIGKILSITLHTFMHRGVKRGGYVAGLRHKKSRPLQKAEAENGGRLAEASGRAFQKPYHHSTLLQPRSQSCDNLVRI